MKPKKLEELLAEILVHELKGGSVTNQMKLLRADKPPHVKIDRRGTTRSARWYRHVESTELYISKGNSTKKIRVKNALKMYPSSDSKDTSD